MKSEIRCPICGGEAHLSCEGGHLYQLNCFNWNCRIKIQKTAESEDEARRYFENKNRG